MPIITTMAAEIGTHPIMAWDGDGTAIIHGMIHGILAGVITAAGIPHGGTADGILHGITAVGTAHGMAAGMAVDFMIHGTMVTAAGTAADTIGATPTDITRHCRATVPAEAPDPTGPVLPITLVALRSQVRAGRPLPPAHRWQELQAEVHPAGLPPFTTGVRHPAGHHLQFLAGVRHPPLARGLWTTAEGFTIPARAS